MKLAKDKKVIISISLIIILLAVSVIGIISRGIQTTTGITTDLENAKDASVVQSNSTLTETSAEWAKVIGGDKSDYILSVIATKDGGYLVGGNFSSASMDLGNVIIINHHAEDTKYSDGMIIKYSSTGVAEWAKTIGGDKSDSITSIIETTDEGYLVGGYFNSSSIDLGNNVSISNTTDTNGSTQDGMIIKYSSTGVAEWAKTIGGDKSDRITSIIETTDGGYLVGGDFNSSSIDLGNNVSISNTTDGGTRGGMIIKYSSTGVAQWTKQIKATGTDSPNANISNIINTRDGGYVVTGYFFGYIDLGNNIIINHTSGTHGSGSFIIKYNKEGIVQLAKSLYSGDGNTNRISVIQTTDGGYLISSDITGSGHEAFNGIKENGGGPSFIIVMKCDSNINSQWVKSIYGSWYVSSYSTIQTADGGYLVSIASGAETIDLGNNVSITNHSDIMFDGAYNNSGYIIKYNSLGIAQWAKEIGGANIDNTTLVVATKDGGYLVGGDFRSASIDLENNVSISNAGTTNSMLIKFRDVIVPTVKIEQVGPLGNWGRRICTRTIYEGNNSR